MEFPLIHGLSLVISKVSRFLELAHSHDLIFREAVMNSEGILEWTCSMHIPLPSKYMGDRNFEEATSIQVHISFLVKIESMDEKYRCSLVFDIGVDIGMGAQYVYYPHAGNWSVKHVLKKESWMMQMGLENMCALPDKAGEKIIDAKMTLVINTILQSLADQHKNANPHS